jgi:uncharacterized membrane protein
VSPRALKIALAASVALNVFALAGGATAWWMVERIERRVEDQRGPPREGSFHDIVGSVDPQVRSRVRDTLRASALAARPDFEAARAARREALALSASPQFDAARVEALLTQSRQAEERGRARLEREAVALLATLQPADRQALSGILKRKGRGDRRERPDR